MVLAAWFGASSLISHPDYLAYFNEFAGSEPENIVVDSDLDWGQDVKRLAARLREVGLPVENVFKVNEGRPNIADLIRSGDISLVINTPLGRVSHYDEQAIRRAALQFSVPCVTTMTGAQALVEAIADHSARSAPNVHSIQELHAMSGSMDAVTSA